MWSSNSELKSLPEKSIPRYELYVNNGIQSIFLNIPPKWDLISIGLYFRWWRRLYIKPPTRLTRTWAPLQPPLGRIGTRRRRFRRLTLREKERAAKRALVWAAASCVATFFVTLPHEFASKWVANFAIQMQCKYLASGCKCKLTNKSVVGHTNTHTHTHTQNAPQASPPKRHRPTSWPRQESGVKTRHYEWLAKRKSSQPTHSEECG